MTRPFHRRTIIGSASAAMLAPVWAFGQQTENGRMATGITHINPDGMHRNAAFSQAVLIPSGMQALIIGGQNGVDASGKVVSDDLAGQTAQAVDNLIAVLEAAGATLNDLVQVRLYVTGDEDITPGFEQWMRRAGSMENPPTVSVLRVAGLASPAYLIEIDGLAFLA